MGTSISTVIAEETSETAVLGKQQCCKAYLPTQQECSGAVPAADSVSSISGSHLEMEQEQKQQKQQLQEQQHKPLGRNLLAAVKDRFRKPLSAFGASWVTAGLAPTPELHAAVLAAYAEVVAGAKLNFPDFYQMGPMLGTGHYARVHEAKRLQDGALYAVKVLPKATKKHKAREQLQRVVKEVAVLRLLSDHPSAVQLQQVLQDKQSYYLVMEHCSGGELFDYAYKLDHLPEAEAAYFMQQLASFLAHAHAKNIAHRDIKPENILLAPVGDSSGSGPCSWRLKVIDYGCSAFCIPGQKLHEAVGTVCYVAPEVLRHDYDVQSDVWSAGVVMYMLLCGYLPFDGNNNEETLMLVRAGDFDMLPEDWGHVSQAGQDLVKQLLAYKPADRLTAVQLLQHPWIQLGTAPCAAEMAAGPTGDVAATAGAAT